MARLETLADPREPAEETDSPGVPAEVSPEASTLSAAVVLGSAMRAAAAGAVSTTAGRTRRHDRPARSQA